MIRNLADKFERDRYVVFRPSLPAAEVSLLDQYARDAAAAGAMLPGDTLVPETPCKYGDPIMDSLLNRVLPEVEATAGLPLFPTYSYIRVYKRGDILTRHVDRPSCEISVTLCLGSEPPKPWPLWIKGPHGIRSIALGIGDALLYRGMECPHWRDMLCGNHVVQVFLHYVEQHGPNAEWKYDKRAASL
jgi:hypothetical protein